MCGIGAVFDMQPERLEIMASKLESHLMHRGPDGSGIKYLTSSAGLCLALVHRRLAIIDLTHAADQPMMDESGNVLIFNGEIYNHTELRAELEAKGEIFCTHSDTEVLLRAYRYYDIPSLLKRLRGMFAFALWDAGRQRLVIARDPMGIKPLYYSRQGHFACASEASALVTAGVVDREISMDGLDSFLAFGSVVAPTTIWKGVEALQPGYFLIVNSHGLAGEPVRYWSWDEAGRDVDLFQALARSMDRHLVADVPVSLFLSGGYDSTAIATLASARSDRPLHTFTATFADHPAWSEGKLAKDIATRLGTVHHEVALDAYGVMRKLQEFFSGMDQPSDDGLNVKLISEAVADAGFKVALHGVGGDELFGGYPSHRDLPRTRWLAKLPIGLRRLIANVVNGSSIKRSKLAELLRGDGSLLAGFLTRRRLFSLEQREALLGADPPLGVFGIPESSIVHAQSEISDANDIFAAISRLELDIYASNKLLIDGDVMSMSNGLEVRFPLLDVDLVATALQLPADQKVPMGTVAKPALSGAVPNFPYDLMTKNKRGFTLPLNSWMRSELRNECLSVLERLPNSLGLQVSAVETVWHDFEVSMGGQQWQRVWQLYALGSWYEQHSQ